MTKVRDMKKGREMRPYPRFGAGEETRTPTLSKQILSLSRLPIPPRPHIITKRRKYLKTRIPPLSYKSKEGSDFYLPSLAGTPSGTRTLDPLIKSQLLSQLS